MPRARAVTVQDRQSAVMGQNGTRQSWNTADRARIGDAPEVWELTTFWDGPDGTAMATLERLTGGRIETTFSLVADLQPVT